MSFWRSGFMQDLLHGSNQNPIIFCTITSCAKSFFICKSPRHHTISVTWSTKAYDAKKFLSPYLLFFESSRTHTSFTTHISFNSLWYHTPHLTWDLLIIYPIVKTQSQPHIPTCHSSTCLLFESWRDTHTHTHTSSSPYYHTPHHPTRDLLIIHPIVKTQMPHPKCLFFFKFTQTHL